MKIQEQFKEREKAYDTATRDILKSLTHVTEAVQEVLGGENELIEWRQVERVKGVVVLAALVTLPIGYEITLDSGDTVIVDEESQEGMRRLIRVGLPVKLINREDKELIREYLLKNSDMKQAPEQEQKEEEEPTPEFETDSLSQEQIREMMWHQEHTSKGKVS